MPDPISQLRKAAEKSGVTIEEKANGHFQILGGAVLVNYYPLSKRRSLYVAGTARGVDGVLPDQAVAMALRAPKLKKKRVKRKQRKPKTKRRIRDRLMKKQKGLCCFCADPMEVTEDVKNLKQATFEHVVPLARGGLDHENNIKLSCLECNRERGCDMPEIIRS